MPQKLLLPTFITTLLCLAGITWLLTIKSSSPTSPGTAVPDNSLSGKTLPGAPIKEKENEIPMGKADAAMRAYRDRIIHGTQTKLMIYKPELLIQYLNDNFLKSTSRITPPTDYEWRLALAVSYFESNGDLKLGTVFTPVLVNSQDTTQVIDYYNAKFGPGPLRHYYTDYFEPLNNRSIANGKISIFYDESQLWP